jgi:O-antigen/teichoic acid export membrane protein
LSANSEDPVIHPSLSEASSLSEARSRLGHLTERLPLGRFGRSVAVLAGGTALGQGLVVLATPLITRLYTPEDMGALTVYMSILAILLVAVCLRYELAIPLPKEDKTAANLLAVSLLAVVLTSVLAAILLAVLGGSIVRWINTPNLAGYLWLLPVGMLGGGIYKALSYWALRRKAFSRIAGTRLNQSAGQVLVQLVLGFMRIRPLGLLVGQVVGQVAGSSTLGNMAWRQDKPSLKGVSPAGVASAASRYRRFPLLSSGSSLLNSGALQLPALLLAALYGPQVAGWFGLTQRLIRAPMTLVGDAVAQVYLAEAAVLAQTDQKAVQKLFFKTALRLLLVGGIPLALIGVVGPWLFPIVFGKGWSEAGVYVQILAAMFVFQFVVSPISQTLNILERQDLQLAWDSGRLLLMGGVFWLGSSARLLPARTLTLYSVAMAVAYVALFVLSFLALRRKSYPREEAAEIP